MWLIFVALVYLYLGIGSIKLCLEAMLLAKQLLEDKPNDKTKKQWKLEE